MKGPNSWRRKKGWHVAGSTLQKECRPQDRAGGRIWRETAVTPTQKITDQKSVENLLKRYADAEGFTTYYGKDSTRHAEQEGRKKDVTADTCTVAVKRPPRAWCREVGNIQHLIIN